MLAKLAGRYLLSIQLQLAVLTTCGSVLGLLVLGSANVLDSLGLKEIHDDHKMWFGVGFVTSVALLAIMTCTVIWNVSSRQVLIGIKKSKIIKRLHSMTVEEKAILGRYILDKSRTQALRDSGVVHGLEGAGIIYRTTQESNFDLSDYNIDDWAWEHLHDHLH